MGAWSVAVFSNDDAMDIRDDYREHIILGLSEADAEAKIIEEFEGSDSLWLALGLTQWRFGRLSQRVKENALGAIDAEISDIADIWEPGDIKKRIKVLEEARAKLLSPMGNKTKLRMPWYAWTCPWPVGSVIQMRIPWMVKFEEYRDKYVLLQVVGVRKSKPGKMPLEAVAVSLFEGIYDSAPAERRHEFEDIVLPLVPFVTITGIQVDAYTFQIKNTDIKACDMRIISEAPLMTAPYALRTQETLPRLVTSLDYYVCAALKHHTQSPALE